MTRHIERLFVCFSFLALLTIGSDVVAGSSNGAESNPATVAGNNSEEAKLIAGMASEDPRKVLNALDDLEEKPNPGTNAISAARKLLPDPRPSVRKKAARVLGAIHAQVDENDLKAICRMLKSYDQSEADAALKALRGLDAPETIPEITPLLKSPHRLLVRDACRTLAVLGNKDLIPLIEPLLNDPDADVRKDAQSAIISLQEKN